MEGNNRRRSAVSNIVLIGLVSLFMDLSTEMVYPLIPLYLTATLGATPAIVGVIEGVAESIASLLKVFSGYIGDVYQNKKKLAFAGYSASVLYKLMLLVSASWPGVLLARIIDRTGKGIRTAPRDALVAQSAGGRKLGGSFGLHKMLDMGGASLGVRLAFLFVATGRGFQKAFLYSIVPAVISILIIPLIREDKTERISSQRLSLKTIRLDGRLKKYLAVVFLFSLGNSSNTFLLLKAQQSGFSAASVILLYLVYHLSTTALAIPAGKLSDRFGRSRILVPGYLIYGLVYLGISAFAAKWAFVLLFFAYGAYTALISGAERAFIAESAPPDFKGTLLGLYGMLQGIGLLLSSVVAGLLWELLGSDAPFFFGPDGRRLLPARFVHPARETQSINRHPHRTRNASGGPAERPGRFLPPAALLNRS
jgi:MFS family permease